MSRMPMNTQMPMNKQMPMNTHMPMVQFGEAPQPSSLYTLPSQI